jgi:hypothetical protein
VVGWIISGITDAINAFFRGLARAALGSLLDILGQTLLTTPTPAQLPAAGRLWTTSWQLSLAVFPILVMAGGILAMSHESVQARTSLKEIASRIPVAFLAAALSQFFAGTAIDAANALTAAVLGDFDAAEVSETLRDLVLGAFAGQSNPIFLILLGNVLGVLLTALLCVYLARVAVTVALIGAAPLLLCGHALPQTDGIARWWWKAFGAVLAIQLAQSLVLVAFLRVFLAPGGFTVLGPTPNGLVNLLAAVTLVYILFKIPFWLFASLRVGHGRSFIGRLARAYVMGRAFGLLGGRGGAGGWGRRGFGGRGGGFGGRGGGGGGRGGGGRAGGRGPGGASGGWAGAGGRGPGGASGGRRGGPGTGGARRRPHGTPTTPGSPRARRAGPAGPPPFRPPSPGAPVPTPTASSAADASAPPAFQASGGPGANPWSPPPRATGRPRRSTSARPAVSSPVPPRTPPAHAPGNPAAPGTWRTRARPRPLGPGGDNHDE